MIIVATQMPNTCQTVAHFICGYHQIHFCGESFFNLRQNQMLKLVDAVRSRPLVAKAEK